MTDVESRQDLIDRLASRENTLEAAYAWSMPDGVNESDLVYRVIQAGIYRDMLALAKRIGITRFMQAVDQHPRDHFTGRRQQIADSIHVWCQRSGANKD